YTFTDSLNNIPVGIINYRIKQVIDTVSSSAIYLDSFTLTKNNSCIAVIPNETKTIHIYPNPVQQNNLSVAINTDNAIAELHLQVVDMNGSTLSQEIKSKSAGRSIITMPIKNLPAGKYNL